MSRLRLIDPNEAPAEAMTWATAAEGHRLLYAWAAVTMARHGQEGRVVRVAWAVWCHINIATGYAFPSDGRLSAVSNTHISHVPTALRTLEASGLIVRAHVPVSAALTQRRIWLARKAFEDAPDVGDEPVRPPAVTAGTPPATMAGQKKET